ncbi:hypothetical protein [Bradyrhizobium barranii]
MISVFSAMTRSLDVSSAWTATVTAMVTEQNRPKIRPIEPQFMAQKTLHRSRAGTRNRATIESGGETSQHPAAKISRRRRGFGSNG